MHNSIPALRRRSLCNRFQVCPIGIGCWAIGGPAHNLGLPIGWSTADDAAALEGLGIAFQLGANLFDTADVYGLGHSERLLGQFLAKVPRSEVVLSSKVGYFSGTSVHPYAPAHMRRQLETTLENLGTPYLDLYAFHNANFGPDDKYLEPAIAELRNFQQEGLVGAIGMRGPHRFALDRGLKPTAFSIDKHQRFLELFDQIQPDYIALRFNALTPIPRVGTRTLFSYVADHGVDVLLTKPLCQGLLTGKYRPETPPEFTHGDHRLNKSWFSGQALELIMDGLAPLRDRFGATQQGLVRAALNYCVQQADNVVALVGFTTPEQVRQNLEAVREPLEADDIRLICDVGAQLRERLDARGQFFTDSN